MSMVSSALHSAIEKTDIVEAQSAASLIISIVEGNLSEDIITVLREKTKEAGIEPPWMLVASRNTVSSGLEFSKGRLWTDLMRFKTANISIKYETEVIALLSENMLNEYLVEFRNSLDLGYYAIGVSLPLLSLVQLPARYKQAMYALKSGDGSPGIYDSRVLSFQYLLERVKEDNAQLGFAHPAIETLKDYDLKNGTSLYNTLLEYLSCERSSTATSKRLFIHRNTLSARIEKIEDLITIDLNDPFERMYILLPDLINK